MDKKNRYSGYYYYNCRQWDTWYSGDGGPATAAQFQNITDLAVDGIGNIYIADAGNNCIRKINTAGIISTIAGNGTAGYNGDGISATAAELNHPSGIAVDNINDGAGDDGDIFIADTYNDRVRQIDTFGMITTIAGTGTAGYSGDNGPATAAELFNPYGVDYDYYGDVLVADWGNHVVRDIEIGFWIRPFAGNGTPGYTGDGGLATNAELTSPVGIAVDNGGYGIIYICDIGAYNVRMINYTNVGIPMVTPPKEGNTLQITPVPNNGTFSLFLSSATSQPAQVTVTNMVGEKVKELNIPTNKQTEIQLLAPPGMYFITATTTEGMQYAKIVVQ